MTRNRTVDLAWRFWPKVLPVESGCWEWQGAKGKSNHGSIGMEPHRRNVGAHRVVWEMVVGPIPPGMLVCHHCDNPPCVNPAHLYIGTVADNSRDSRVRKRSANSNTRRTHCRWGHEFTPENTYRVPSSGARVCITCQKLKYLGIRGEKVPSLRRSTTSEPGDPNADR